MKVIITCSPRWMTKSYPRLKKTIIQGTQVVASLWPLEMIFVFISMWLSYQKLRTPLAYYSCSWLSCSQIIQPGSVAWLISACECTDNIC